MLRVIVAIALVGCGRINFGDLSDGAAVDTPYNLAFVTSTSISLVPGGVAAADAECRARADAANLPGDYVAYLSTTTTPAMARLTGSRGWVRVDGRPFTDDIVLARILYPLRLDETGAPRSRTNVATGAPGAGADFNCGDFTANTSVTTGLNTGGGTWFSSFTQLTCSDAYPVYCLGIGRNVPLERPSRGARIAFVSSLWAPGAGIGDADVLCQNDATANGLPGTFLALLATDTASASSRFDGSRPMWTRLDGVELAASMSAFDAGEFSASLNTMPDGNYLDSAVWTGAQLPMSIGQFTCANWTDGTPNQVAHVGFTLHGDTGLFHSTVGGCQAQRPVYCLQQ